MTAPLPADAFVPVPLRWRHVLAGDVMVAPGGALWLIAVRGRDGLTTAMRTGADQHSAPVDPDEVVQVLVPVAERDAVELTREQLGARLVERRTA